MKNTLGEINRLVEAEDWIGDLEDKVGKKHPSKEAERKQFFKLR